MFRSHNMYESNDDMPDEDEMNDIIDEQIAADHEQCEFVCSCGCKFNTEEGIEGDSDFICCPECGDEMERDEEYENWVRSL